MFLSIRVEWVMGARWMEGHPKFKAFDKAIGREGFKIILLLRLSPIFPFALSNYMVSFHCRRKGHHSTTTEAGCGWRALC